MKSFTDRVASEIFDCFPEWKAYATYERHEEGAPYLLITPPTPLGANTPHGLRISTYDDEVTVDFDYYHSHFDRWEPDPADTHNESAKLYVAGLLSEHIAVASWWQGESCRVCSQYEPGTTLAIPFKVPFDRVRVRSWAGSFNWDVDS